jgi:hypothetical protein
MVVDVEGALSSGDLTSNIYLVDTNKYVGSGNEGQAELMTKLSNGDIIQWTVAPVQPDGQVSIASFSGTAVTQKIINPQQDPTTGAFASKFNSGPAPSGTSYQYTATLQFESKQLTFDPFLIVK